MELPNYRQKKWLDPYLRDQTEHNIDMRGLPLQNMIFRLITDYDPQWLAVSAREKRYLNATLSAVVRYDGVFPIRVERWIGGSVMEVGDVPILPFVNLPNDSGNTYAYLYLGGPRMLLPITKIGAENVSVAA